MRLTHDPRLVILSEAKDLLLIDEQQILRFAQDDQNPLTTIRLHEQHETRGP